MGGRERVFLGERYLKEGIGDVSDSKRQNIKVVI